MEQINLIHPEKSDRLFDIITFPDGEKHIKFHTEIHRKEEYNVLTILGGKAHDFSRGMRAARNQKKQLT